jgi:hypothetical protein
MSPLRVNKAFSGRPAWPISALEPAHARSQTVTASISGGCFRPYRRLFICVAEVNWELRCLGVLVTVALALHAAKRMQLALGVRVLVAAIVITTG